MKHREILLRAAGVAAAALGMDVASGRALAAFYAQTADASWLGVLFSGVFFGGMTALVCAWSSRCGAVGPAGLLRRLPGKGSGRLIAALYVLIQLAAVCMLAGEAAHMGALALPVHNAQLYAALIALLFSSAVALTGGRAVQGLGAIFLACLCVYFAALLFFARLPQSGLNYGLELKLGNSVSAALVLALLHSAVGVCVSCGTAAKQFFCVRPGLLGLYAGAVYAAVLGLGNAVLQAKEPIILRLKAPFAALSCAWGTPGFYLGAGMVYLGCVAALSGILYGNIPKRKSRILIEN